MQRIGVLEERRPAAAYGHLLPQGEKGKQFAASDVRLGQGAPSVKRLHPAAGSGTFTLRR